VFFSTATSIINFYLGFLLKRVFKLSPMFKTTWRALGSKFITLTIWSIGRGGGKDMTQSSHQRKNAPVRAPVTVYCTRLRCHQRACAQMDSREDAFGLQVRLPATFMHRVLLDWPLLMLHKQKSNSFLQQETCRAKKRKSSHAFINHVWLCQRGCC
jgi:hypothetical protein